MPNHDVPIEEADVWDILDWTVVSALPAAASGDPRDGRGSNALPWMARRLIEAASQLLGRDDEQVLYTVASAWIGYDASAAVRRQRAGDLAMRLGARPDRLIEYAAYRWGLFKRL